MDKQCFRQIARIVMFLIGLVFCLLIIALIHNTVVDCGQNYCRLELQIPFRLFLLISFYCIAGLCGCLPFHNRVRPKFLPQPFLAWKCMTGCFTYIRDLWHCLRYGVPGNEGFYAISVDNGNPEYFRNPIRNQRNITNPHEESQTNDKSPQPGSSFYKCFKSAASAISEVKSRISKLLRRENDRTKFLTRQSHSQQDGPLHLETPGMFPCNFGSQSPEALSFRSDVVAALLSVNNIDSSSNGEYKFFTPLSSSNESIHPPSKSEDGLPFESDIHSSNTASRENVTSEQDPRPLEISPGVSLGEERREAGGSAAGNRKKNTLTLKFLHKLFSKETKMGFLTNHIRRRRVPT